MAKQVTATEIPEDEVDDIVAAFENLGSTDVKKTKQKDGTYTVQGTLPD